MKTVRIGDITIGRGVPKLITSVSGGDVAELLDNMKAAAEFDIIEWRADHFTGIERADLKAIIGKLKYPLLFTYRTEKEGGSGSNEIGTYTALNRQAIDTGDVDIIDLEYQTLGESFKELADYAGAKGVKVIASYHNFEKTPSIDKLFSLFKLLQTAGDISKIAVMPNNFKDVLILCEALHEFRENFAEKPVIGISMSKKGVISRIGAENFGSDAVYAAALTPLAPGQISAHEMRKILRTLYRVNNPFIARPGEKEAQPLSEHLLGVSELAAEYGGTLGLGQVCRLVGLLHDLGKYSDAFQEYINRLGEKDFDRDDTDDEKTDPIKLKGKIDHSTAGAQWIWDEWHRCGEWQGWISAQIASICIASHHSGLIDIYDEDGNNTLQKRIEKDRDITHYNNELLKRFELLEEADTLSMPALKELTKKLIEIRDSPVFINNAEKHRNTKDFYYGMLTKMIFSCLIDADRINSAEWEGISVRSKGLPHWDSLIGKIDNPFDDKSYINTIRDEVSDRCKEMAYGKQGIYRLTVPTGGGKTLASLRYALHHAQKHNLRRIIYVIPYTSIIEQNAEEVRKKLELENDNEWILEQHSNLIPEKKTYRNKILSNSWDAPIIFTTMYQFLSVLFSGETHYTRRMHSLAESVMIFDEIQTLPVRCAHIFSNAVNFLAEHAGCSALLCTATQPLLDGISPERGSIRISGEIIPDIENLFNSLKRVKLYDLCEPKKWDTDTTARFAEDEFKTGSVLIITNTKRLAKELYRSFPGIPSNALFHLSTYMCAAHRSKTIKEIKERLSNREPVLCVSTRLIEAGVNIDFDVVIRSLAGLDSIAQAAGRGNREMRAGVTGKVYIIDPDENVESLPDIREGQFVVTGILQKYTDDILSPEAMEDYFKSYFFNRKNEMSYKIGGKSSGITLLQLLGSNRCSTSEDSPLPLLKQSFKRAGEEFRVFDEKTSSVIVPYGEGEQIIAELNATDPDNEIKKFYSLLIKAQRYSVELYENELEELENFNAVHRVKDTGLIYLNKEYYHDKLGLSFEQVKKQDIYSI
jgi:CRISPR-associated endonuclease/helicase Cas3